MKKGLQKEAKQTPKFTNRELSKPSLKADAFIESMNRSFILYNMDQPSNKQFSIKKMSFDMPIIKHVFFNTQQLIQNRQSAKFSTSFTKISDNSQSIFKTFNNTQFTQNDEEQEYSNYLREYETVIKNSRRKQYISPQKQHKQMNLLINQFLSDIQAPSAVNIKSNKSIITPIKQQNRDVRIEKIDLLSYQSNKSSQKFINIPSVNRNKSKKKMEEDVREKEAKSKFIDIAKLNTAKKNSEKKIDKYQKEKDKEKIKIEVIKVNDLRLKNTSPSAKARPQAKIIFPQHTFTQMQQFIDKNSPTYKKQQQTQGNYAQSYLKKKQLKDQRPSDSSNTSQKSFEKQVPLSQQKKPIKIQIDIPLDELQQSDYTHFPRQPKQMLNELDIQGEQIIKVVSQTIRGLLQKNKNISGKSK